MRLVVGWSLDRVGIGEDIGTLPSLSAGRRQRDLLQYTHTQVAWDEMVNEWGWHKFRELVEGI